MEIELVSEASEEELKEDMDGEKQISEIQQVENVDQRDESRVIELDQIELV